MKVQIIIVLIVLIGFAIRSLVDKIKELKMQLKFKIGDFELLKRREEILNYKYFDLVNEKYEAYKNDIDFHNVAYDMALNSHIDSDDTEILETMLKGAYLQGMQHREK